MKRKITLVLCILIFQLSFIHAQNWLWGAEGSSYSDNYGVAADNSGNGYLAGSFYNSIRFGNQSLNSLFQDAFLIKYDASGNILWAKQSKSLGPSSNCEGVYICSDTQKNIYYSGLFEDSVCFGKDTLGKIPNSFYELFLVKYDSNGKVIWARQSTTPAANFKPKPTCATAVDHSGNIFLTGTFLSAISFGIYPLSSASYAPCLVKYNAGGNVIWARQAVPSSSGESNSVAVDDSGNVYMAGDFMGSITFGATTLSSVSKDAFLVKYDSNGNVRWAVQSNSASASSSCQANAVTSDVAGNIYITGGAYGTISFGPYTLTTPQHNGNTQLFLVKYNSKGKIIWAKQSEGMGADGYSLATDHIHNIYLSGGVGSGLQEDSVIYDSKLLKLSNNPSDPSIIFKLDTAGSLVCGSMINTGGDDNNGVACSPSGLFVYFGGDLADSIILGNDSLKVGFRQEYPFIARWQPCCNDPVSLTGNTSLCKGSGGVLSTSGGGSYLWNTGSTNASIAINPYTTTTYSVTIKNSGCIYTLSKTVAVNSEPVVTICCDTIIRDGESVQLISGGGGLYSWSPNTGLNCDTCPNPIATPSQTTTYTLTITNDSGCIATKFVTIDVECGQVFIPDIFSPNQHVNNIFYVRGSCISVLDFMIFDRWGNKVYETHNKDNGWDGTYGGHPMNTGTYMYYAKATMYDGSVVEKKGSVTLVR